MEKLRTKISESIANLVIKEMEKMHRNLINTARDYNNKEKPDIPIGICQEFLKAYSRAYPKIMEPQAIKKVGREIRRLTKVVMSYYETGNPELAYQYCLNVLGRENLGDILNGQ